MIRKFVRTFEPTLRALYLKVFFPPPPNLAGDRNVEYSWIAANCPEGPGTALDFGCGEGYMGLVAAQRGFNTTALDLEKVSWPYRHESLHFRQGSILDAPFKSGSFDLIINCSAIEHVGLIGRYGVTEADTDGDIAAMKIMAAMLKPTGLMLLTLPVGRDCVFHPYHRIYGELRLPRLIEQYRIISQQFWIKDDYNRWYTVSREEAVSFKPQESIYGLGALKLAQK